QGEFGLGGSDGLSTAEQEYNPTPIINEIRGYVTAWRNLPYPNQWQVTPETGRLLRAARDRGGNARSRPQPSSEIPCPALHPIRAVRCRSRACAGARDGCRTRRSCETDRAGLASNCRRSQDTTDALAESVLLPDCVHDLAQEVLVAQVLAGASVAGVSV